MKIINNTTNFKINEETAVAIGKFDGIHLGHQVLFKELQLAKKQGLKTVIFTFDPSPGFMFDENYRELFTLEEKRYLLNLYNIDYLIEYPFNIQTACISPVDYIEKILVEKLNAKLIIAGSDITFGHKGQGNKELLNSYRESLQYQTNLVHKIKFKDQEISSSLVRECIQLGDMELANLLMGRPYFIIGTVIHGNEFGRKMGFPTANVRPKDGKILPPNGVYFVNVHIEDKIYFGISNVGCKPTVSDQGEVLAETHIFDYDEMLYEKEIKVFFVRQMRKEKTFSSALELQEAIQQDLISAKKFIQKDTKYGS